MRLPLTAGPGEHFQPGTMETQLKFRRSNFRKGNAFNGEFSPASPMGFLPQLSGGKS
jgi:hypothetical protein